MAVYEVNVPGIWDTILQAVATSQSKTPEEVLQDWALVGATDAINSYIDGLSAQQRAELAADSFAEE